MNKPKISVLMPIYYTSPKYLREAIESILGQTFTDFEFIILNDSPEDEKLAHIVKEYKDVRIRYVENPKTWGIAKSYNRLIDLAQGDIVAIMNHDDISLPHRLDVQYEYLLKHPDVGVVGSGYKKFGQLNRFRKVYPKENDEDIRAMLLFKSPIHHPTIMMRKSILVENNIRYNEEYISLNDRQLYYDLSKYTKLVNVGEILYKYRFHKDMVSKRKKSFILAEQCKFHTYWFEDNGVKLSITEMMFFDNFVCCGRCRIRDYDTLNIVYNILEKISYEVKNSNNVSYEKFRKICADYLLKRLLNAGVYGMINSCDILEKTTLPVKNDIRLNLLNSVLWRRG